MITPNDIQEAIKARLGEIFPGETVYDDLVPRNFARPSNLVELKSSVLASTGTRSIKIRYIYTITTFAEVDPAHNTHFTVLDMRGIMILAGFAAGYLKVKERAPKIVASSVNHDGADFAIATLTVEMTYDREEFMESEAYEIMRTLALDTKTKEDS